jgi:hypothetical protein
MVTATLPWSDTVLTISSRGAAQVVAEEANIPAMVMFNTAFLVIRVLLKALRQQCILTDDREKGFATLE